MNVKRFIDTCKKMEGDCIRCPISDITCYHARKILKVKKPLEYKNKSHRQIREKEKQNNGN